MDNNSLYTEAVGSLTKGMNYMIEQALKGITQIYNGFIVSTNGNKYNIRLNGETYALSQYGDFSHSVGETVKVIVPQGNMNMAFFI